MCPFMLPENVLNELNELRFDAEGVLDRNVGAQATHTSRNLVIGLGGMGLKTIVQLKRELNDRMGRIDSNYLQLLSIDTDKEDRAKNLAPNGILVPDEIPDIVNINLGQTINAPKDHRPAQINAILPDIFNLQLTGGGANQTRLAGRLTVMDLNLFGLINSSIKSAIARLKDFNTATLNVHIVAGIGGGTGSGLCVDIPYIVRSCIRQLGLPDSATRIFGHIYLPNSYDGIANPQAAYRNGYAALKEIDYYMNIEKKGETFDALYPAPVNQFSSQKNIFDQCTLIGGEIEGPQIVTEKQKKAIAVCVEDLVNQCTSVVGNIDDNGKSGNITDFFTDTSFHVNAKAALDVVMSDPNVNFPGNHDYCYNFIGSSSIKFPTAAIAEHLVGAVTISAESVLKNNVSTLRQEDVDAFEFGLLRPYDTVERVAKTLADEIDAKNDDPETKWTKDSVKTTTHTEPLEQAAVRAYEYFKNSQMAAIENSISISNTKAYEVFCDPKRGPYYLAELLTSRSAGGGKVVGLFEKLGRYSSDILALKSNYEDTRSKIEVQLRETIEEMQKGGLFGGAFNRLLPTYKDLIKDLTLARFKINLCDMLSREFYINLDEQRGASYRLKSSLENYFLYYVDVISKIFTVTASNLEKAKSELGFGTDAAHDPANDPTSIFSITDSKFNALKSTVRSTAENKIRDLGEKGIYDFIGALTASILDKRDDWQLKTTQSVEPSACAAAFRRFIKGYAPFSDIINRKMIDYFNDAYAGQPDAYKESVIQELVAAVKYNSAPMVKVWGAPYFNFAQVQPLCYQYMVLPGGLSGDGNEWGGRFASAFGAGGLTKNIYWSPDENSIYSYTLYALMPIWLHSRIPEYEKQYYSINTPGVHINEGPSSKFDMKNLPGLMPPDQCYRTQDGDLVHKNDAEDKMYAEIGKTLRYAVKHGIAQKLETGNYAYYVLTDKPNPNDDRSSVRIKKFIDDYFADPDNMDTATNNFKFAGNVFAKMRRSFAADTRPIQIGLNGYAPDTEEKAINLLRRQLGRYFELKAEVDYYKVNFADPIGKINDDRTGDRKLHDFAKYLLFGLVFCNEMGAWNYKLGDAAYPIISKFEVSSNQTGAWKVKFMEMPASAKFIELMDADDKGHKNLLEDRIRTISMGIVTGQDMEAFNNLKASYETLTTRFESVLTEINNRKIAGNLLTPQENETFKFYTQLLESVKTHMAAFSA